MILKLQPGVKADAKFSLCKTERYTLTRTWTPGRPRVCFIGLNPSVADAYQDDRTIRKCMKFIHNWSQHFTEFGGLLMLNVFAYRTTYPAVLLQKFNSGHDVTGGSWNSVSAWKEYFERYDVTMVVAAWGNHAGAIGEDRIQRLRAEHVQLHHLGLNKDGSPKHPLYLRGDLLPTRFP